MKMQFFFGFTYPRPYSPTFFEKHTLKKFWPEKIAESESVQKPTFSQVICKRKSIFKFFLGHSKDKEGAS